MTSVSYGGIGSSAAMKRILALFLLLSLTVVQESEAKCKLHHAKFKAAGASNGPIVSQVSSSRPDKVTVSWKNRLVNQRCIDSYIVHYWRKDLDPVQARSFNLTGPNHSSVTLEVDPCMTYFYQVQFIQHSFWRTTIHTDTSQATKFMTSGIATINSLDKNNFDINYKMTNGVHDLTKAVVSFKRDTVLKNANCISQLKLKMGVQEKDLGGAAAKLRNPTLQNFLQSQGQTGGQVNFPSSQGQTGGQFIPSGANRCNRQASVNEAPVLSSNDDLRIQAKKKLTQILQRRNKRESSTDESPMGQTGGVFNEQNGGTGGTFNDNGQGSTGGTFNGQEGEGGTGGTFNEGNGGTGGTFNEGNGGTGNTFNDDAQAGGYYNDPNQNYQRQSYCQGSNCNGGRGKRSTRSQGRMPTAKPKELFVVVRPPLNDFVSIEMPVPGACDALKTMLHLDVISQSGREIGHFKNLTLPPIDLTKDFQLPSAHMVIRAMTSNEMCDQVPFECTALYLNAIDKKANQIQNELRWYSSQYKLLEKSVAPQPSVAPARSNSTRAVTKSKVDKNQVLKNLGCACYMSKYIKVNVTDANVDHYYPNISGTYEFSGKTHLNKPYYFRNVTKTSAYIMYFNDAKKTWYIDDNLGDSSPKLAMDLTLLECPADPSLAGIHRAWSYVKRLAWNSIRSMSVSCGVL